MAEPGWYDTGTEMRYYDGQAWTEHVRPKVAATREPVAVPDTQRSTSGVTERRSVATGNRPFYRRGWFVAPVSLLAGLVAGYALGSVGRAETDVAGAARPTVTAKPASAAAGATGGAAKPAAPTSAAKPASAAAAAGTQSDDDWTVVSPVKFSGAGVLLTAAIRVRNDAASTRSTFFTVTYLAGDGSVVATFSGAANDVGAGKTVTVTLLSPDELKTPPKGRFEFQAA